MKKIYCFIPIFSHFYFINKIKKGYFPANNLQMLVASSQSIWFTVLIVSILGIILKLLWKGIQDLVLM